MAEPGKRLTGLQYWRALVRDDIGDCKSAEAGPGNFEQLHIHWVLYRNEQRIVREAQNAG